MQKSSISTEQGHHFEVHTATTLDGDIAQGLNDNTQNEQSDSNAPVKSTLQGGVRKYATTDSEHQKFTIENAKKLAAYRAVDDHILPEYKVCMSPMEHVEASPEHH